MSCLLQRKKQILSKETLEFNEFGHANMNSKATLLLIHGHFSSKQAWSFMIEELFSKYDGHVVAVDLRGFGESTYNQKCYELKDWACDLVQLCSVMKIEKCIPIGWSFGGLTSMKIAEIAPKLIDKIVFVASVGFQGLDIKHLLQFWLKRKQLIQNQKIQQYSNFFYAYIQSEKPKYDHIIEGAMKQRCIEEVHKVIQAKSINLQAIMPGLKNSLAIHGVEDPVVKIEDFQKTGKYCKKFMKEEKVGHMIPMKYEKLADVIVDFV